MLNNYQKLLNDEQFMKTYSEAKKKYNKVLSDYGEAFQKCNSKIKF